ncbi:hypothetical protein CA13_12110 [Planctomycetes bacterium CA13]|uniref:Uncharacterized protein n=1 Tax=Novipirellula herctigrandis TaxID=2527986 RepID=A0A5C5YXR3_9BACT|nr:hypothetical protein CA13_12110 [Planctomycetes bacterium CA13]
MYLRLDSTYTPRRVVRIKKRLIKVLSSRLAELWAIFGDRFGR